jgi:hypothetical protein
MYEFKITYQFTLNDRSFENKHTVKAMDSIDARRKFCEMISTPNVRIISVTSSNYRG